MQKFVHYKDRNLILLDIAYNLHMNGLLLHLALAQARIHGNALSEAQAQGTRGETLPFFLRFAFFVSGRRVSVAATRRVRPGRPVLPVSAGCEGPALQTGDRLGRPAVISLGYSHQCPACTEPRQHWPVWPPRTEHRPAPVSAVCSHLHQSCRELPALQHAE